MLDQMLARLTQEERERDIARTQRNRAIREALESCSRDTFIPPALEAGDPRRLRRASVARGSL